MLIDSCWLMSSGAAVGWSSGQAAPNECGKNHLNPLYLSFLIYTIGMKTETTSELF